MTLRALLTISKAKLSAFGAAQGAISEYEAGLTQD